MHNTPLLATGAENREKRIVKD